MSERENVLAALKIVLEEIPEIKTVVRVYLSEFDVTQYAQNQLSLVAIPEPAEETDEELTSQRSLMILATRLMVYFLDWAIDPDSVIYDALVKKIRDKIGDNFTLNDTATETRVASVSAILGTMPVYGFLVDLEMKYYLNEKDS